ncbi:NlpC/P60 family protein [Streptomyces sp. NPDC052040]|uniref:C40 family peptidase n=1 Tax=Streptomyces sp. NPDC052040 TaxID=3365682 RepID=UPI0037D38EC4
MGSHRRLAPTGLGGGRSAPRPVGPRDTEPGAPQAHQALRRTAAALSAAAAAAAATTFGAAPADAAPSHDAQVTVDRLYQEAEQATEAYDRAAERAAALRRRIGQAQDRIARQQGRVNALRDELGSVAGAQYRAGGIASSLGLLLSDDPGEYLDRAATLERIGSRQAGQLRELQSALRELDRERADATGELAALEQNRQAVARHKKTVEGKLAAARRLLASLPATERTAYDRASRSGARVPAPADLATGATAPDARAAAAVAAARSALGRPYIWGASGPSGFDCSGLMQWSYAHAGIGLPRTSQEQRYAGHRVPLSQARPGDLVVYRSDASHVAMYVGGGMVIHAPHPGAAVRYDPVGMMPISSITRP